MQGEIRSVLIVSKDAKAVEFIKSAMPPSRFGPVHCASSASEASRMLMRTPVDIVIINMPLGDEFGTKLAQSASRECAVVALVKPELLERAIYKLEPCGVVTLSKVLSRSVLYQTLMVLSATESKMQRLREDTKKIEEKLHELKLVTKAKSLLISEKGMTEEQAHRFVEKTAMDNSLKKSDAARRIIEDIRRGQIT